MAERDYRRVRTARREDEEREGFIRDRRSERIRDRDYEGEEDWGERRSDRPYFDPIERRAEFGRERDYDYGREGVYGGGSQSAYGGRTGRSSETDRAGSGYGRVTGYTGGYSPSSGYGEGRFYAERDEGFRRREQEGSFAGRGPKNYRRSDVRIIEDVNERLMEHPDIDASEIEVSVSDGIVALSGMVDNRWAKHLAEDIVESVSGVKGVDNRLRVGRDDSRARTGEREEEDISRQGQQQAQPRSRAARR